MPKIQHLLMMLSNLLILDTKIFLYYTLTLTSSQIDIVIGCKFLIIKR